MRSIENKWRGDGRNFPGLEDIPFPSTDAESVARLLAMCPVAEATPLRDLSTLAGTLGVSAILAKDERSRMRLGSFKALGAAYVIAHEARETGQSEMATALAGRTYITASAGNHGLSVAAGARIFGAKAVVFLAETVPESFAARLREQGAEVRRAGADYEASMVAAKHAADREAATLLSDSSWENYTVLPHRLMEGYTQMAAECAAQIEEAPTHIFLQAGVGGMAGAVAAFARRAWGDGPQIIVVEPEAAPALIASVEAGRAVDTEGPVSTMGRLDCKTPSLIALKGLARDADRFMTISDEEAQRGVDMLAGDGVETSPSGGAGFAGALAMADALAAEARLLVFISEGPA